MSMSRTMSARLFVVLLNRHDDVPYSPEHDFGLLQWLSGLKTRVCFQRHGSLSGVDEGANADDEGARLC